MSTVLLIILGLTLWSIASVPLAMLVGRALGGSDSHPCAEPRGAGVPAHGS